MAKNIFKSKTFWFNIVTTAVHLASGKLGFELPEEVSVPVITLGNAGLRLLTKEPVQVVSDKQDPNAF
jgi:hypothetical protein